MRKYSIILLIITILISIAQRWYVENEQKYIECENISNSQYGPIGILPASCAKFAERLFSSQK